jgi:hypothetical protein
MQIIAAMAMPRDGGVLGVSPATITYRDPSLKASESAMIDLSVRKVGLGVESPVDAYMRLHPEVQSREQAYAELETVAAERENLLTDETPGVTPDHTP